MDDAELITAAVKNGDANALRTLLDRHYLTIYKFAFKWCGHKEDAEDIAQDVCIRVAENLAAFKGDSAFTSWLYRITVNVAKDTFRRRGARKEREAGYMETQETTGKPQQETALQAQEAIAALPDDLKETVLLVAGEGLSHAEAGNVLEVAEGTISWRMNKAKAILEERSA